MTFEFWNHNSLPQHILQSTMAGKGSKPNGAAKPKKKLLLNAFDMFTPSHLAFGQWANPRDRSKDKRRDLSYWTDLAKILEKGSFVGYFLADTYGPYDVYVNDSQIYGD